jgi:hypothetical protein
MSDIHPNRYEKSPDERSIYKRYEDLRKERDALQAQVAELKASAVVPDERGTNEYGLDVGYFRKLFNRELNSLRRFRPDELARVLARAARTADASVLQENEFQVGPVVPVATEEMLNEGVRALITGLKAFPENYEQVVSNIWEDMAASLEQEQKS